MEYITLKTQFVVSSVLGIFFTALGGHDILLHILIAMVVTDYCSGIAAGMKNRELSSRTGFNGLIKKAFIFSVVYMANLIDTATGADTFRNVVVMFYISNEGISVLENLGKIGVKYPEKIKDFLIQLGDDENEDSKNTESNN